MKMLPSCLLSDGRHKVFLNLNNTTKREENEGKSRHLRPVKGSVERLYSRTTQAAACFQLFHLICKTHLRAETGLPVQGIRAALFPANALTLMVAKRPQDNVLLE